MLVDDDQKQSCIWNIANYRRIKWSIEIGQRNEQQKMSTFKQLKISQGMKFEASHSWMVYITNKLNCNWDFWNCKIIGEAEAYIFIWVAAAAVLFSGFDIKNQLMPEL